jgi:hypothetical protein
MLAKRLLDAAEDIIEPRLSSMSVRALPSDSAGNGFVVLRSGRSPFGPHRLTTTRDFYVRRGERASRMTAREIRDFSNTLARSGDQVRELFESRFEDAERRFSVLKSQNATGNSPPLLARVTGAPLNPQYIDRLTDRPQLWWIGNTFLMKVDDTDYPCQYPSREFGQRPQFRLRALTQDHQRSDGGLDRLLNAQGLIEFTLRHPWRTVGDDDRTTSRAYFGWIFSLVVGAFAQIRHLQKSLAWDSVDYGLSVSLFGFRAINFRWNDDWSQDGLTTRDELPLVLPQYEVTATTGLDALLALITRSFPMPAASL